ncbi:PP2C family protein-serine/threonine phosphatase [Streptacidiphilus sp. PAMC 29251]
MRLSRGRTLLVIGDVMGHGVAAAVDMSHYSSMLRVVAELELPPQLILERMDQMMAKVASARPATCLLALIDPRRGVCTFSSAGHLPPAMVGPDNRITLVPVPVGPPLGSGFGGYHAVTTPVRPGRTLLLYTDGLVERRNEDIDESLARLAALRLPIGASLEQILEHLLTRLDVADAEDDVAVLAARIVAD